MQTLITDITVCKNCEKDINWYYQIPQRVTSRILDVDKIPKDKTKVLGCIHNKDNAERPSKNGGSFNDECENRYPDLKGIFEPICVDLLSEKLQLPCTELIVANLLVEYIGYGCFKKVVQITKPKHVSCIIQINTGESFVSNSPYIHEFDGLDEVHHQMEEKELIRSMQDIGYKKELLLERELPNGKKFVRIDFVK